MFRIFQKPVERLKSAIEDARQRKANSAAGLRTAITKDGREVAEAGDTNMVCEAYHELAILLAETGQAGTAITTVDELRHQVYGSEQALTTSLALLSQPGIGETEILRLGGWLSEGGRLKNAVSALRNALDERFRRSAPLAILLGDALMEAGETVEAAQRYRLALDLNRDEGPALLPRFEKLAGVLPKDALTQQTLGWLYFTQRSYSQAIQHLETALTLGEIESGLLFALSDAYLETKNHARAVDVFERLLKQGANAAELIRRSDQLLDRYIGQDWISRRTLRLLGDVLRSQQRPDEALTRYRQSLENLEVEEGNQPFALSLLERLLEIEPHVSQNSQAELHLVMALVYLLTGKPDESTKHCLQAVKADRLVGPAAVDGLNRIVSEYPKHRPALLELACLQLELEDFPAALIALNRLRLAFPKERPETVGIYRQLLNRLDRLAGEKTAASEGYIRTLSGTLDALAEEVAETDPAAALSYLERMLALAGAVNTRRVLELVEKLSLVQAAPAGANLLVADAHLTLDQYNDALEACKAVPVEKQYLQAVLTCLEQIASRDAFPVHALIYAADYQLALKLIKPALPYLQRAYEGDSATAAVYILERLEEPRTKGELPAEGLTLLSDALLLRPQPGQAEWLLGVLQDLLRSPGYGMQVVEKAERYLSLFDPGSAVAYRYHLLQADGWLTTTCLEEASETLQQALTHPALKLEDVLGRLEKITGLENAPAQAWLTLADALLKSKKPDLLRVNQAYRSALQINLSDMAGLVLERLPGVISKKGSAEALAFHSLRAHCLAGQGKTNEAINEAREILKTFASAGVIEVLSLADMLPDGAETWYLRAEAEITRQQADIAAGWMDAVSQKGSEALVKRGEAVLQDWIKSFPKQPALRLSHAIALNRLGQSEAASSELSAVATDFPAARGRAMELLNTILEKAQNAATWMEMARGLLAQENIPQTLEYLRKAWAEPGFASKAYGLLKELNKRHAKDASVLRAMVELETLLGEEAHLNSAVGHTYEWLAVTPQQAAEAAQVLETTVGQSAQSLKEDHPVALKVRLVRVDALLKAGMPDQAALAMLNVLDIWPGQYSEIKLRSQSWLKHQESKSIRLVLVQADLVGGEFATALESLADMRYSEVEDLQDFIQQAEAMVQTCQRNEPKLAGQACQLIAVWQVQLQALEAGKDASHRACRLNVDLLPEMLEWLAGAGWDAESQRELDFCRAEICCQAGEMHFSNGLVVYSDLLSADFERNVEEILRGLKQFPKEYWPAHQLELDVFTRLTPDFYPQVFTEMKSMLDEFGSQHADEMLATLDKMDQAIAGTHLMRADIYETWKKLDQAAASLLGMQQAIPDHLDVIEDAFRELIERYPDVSGLQIALGDAERVAQKWEEALRIYRVVQQQSPENIPDLLARYADLLVHQPDDCQVRWALAEACRTQEAPDESALYLDQITDLDWETGVDAAEFATGLTKRWPRSGAAWFVSGKLAYRKNQWSDALRLLERARKEGVPDVCQVRLHDMLARTYHATADLEKALADIRCAAALAPDDPAIRQELVAVRLALMDVEITQQKREIQQHPGDHQMIMALAELLLWRGEINEALPLWQSLLGGEVPQGRVHLRMAECFSASGLHHLAAGSLQAAFNTGLLTAEERKEALYRQASALRRLLRFDEAIHSLEQILLEDLGYLNTRQLVDEIQREKVAAQVSPGTLKPGSRFLPEPGQGR